MKLAIVDITRYRHSVLIGVLFLMFAGLLALKSLPISLFPKSTKPVVRMTVNYDFDMLTFKSEQGEEIERSLLNLENVEKIESTYQLNNAKFMVHFNWEKEANQAITDVTSVASFYQTELPEHLPAIRVNYIDPGIENYVVISSDKYDAKTLSSILNERLSPALNELDGILNYKIAKTNKDEVIVQIDPLALIQYDVTIEQTIGALKTARFDINLGNIRNNKSTSDQHVFLIHKASSLNDLRNLIIKKQANQFIRLSDVARVKLKIGEQARVYYIGDKPAVAVAVWPKPEVNLYQFSQEFRQIIDKNILGIGEVISLNDPLTYISESLEKIVIAVLLGMLFSAIAVFFAFTSFRLTLLSAVIMPVSLISSALILKVFGVGLNIVSLGAMSVATGLVVDNAVVMLDALVDGVQEATPNSFIELRQAIINSVAEVRPSIIASSMTTIVVFLPLAFTLPIIYSLVGELAVVVVSILLFSILIALFFLPCAVISLCYAFGHWNWLVKKQEQPKSCFRQGYEYIVIKLINSRLSKTFLMIISIVAIICALYLLIYKVQREIVAEAQPNIIDIALNFNSADYSQLTREKLVSPVRAQVEKEFGNKIRHIFSDIRKSVAYISLHIKDYRDAESMMSQLRQQITDNQSYSIDISPWVSAKLQVPNIPDLRIFSVAQSEQQKRDANKQLSKVLRSKNFVSRLKSYPRSKQHNQLEININPSALNALYVENDFTSMENKITNHIRYVTEPRYLYPIKLTQGEVALKVLLTGQRIQTKEALGDIPIKEQNKIINLRHLLDIKNKKGWSEYYTRNGKDIFMTEVWLKNPNDPNVRGKIDLLLSELGTKNNGQYIVLDSDEEINSNIKSLIVSLFSALILVIITLLVLNQSIIYTSIILFSVPLGFMGAGFALFWFDSTISINSLIGLMLLTGLTINNVILITDKHSLYLRKNPMISDDLLIATACGSRLRATTITTFTTVLSLLPIAYGLGPNGDIMQPLGISVAAGLLLSLLFSLLLTPILLQLGSSEIKRGLTREGLLEQAEANSSCLQQKIQHLQS
jgi:HAE1 family hydrophobic/amphiphilic exporter-1